MINLSIIIPVYNVEKYLFQCLDSVLKQSLDNFEIIVVNDHSPGNCEEIIDEYKKYYGNIRLINHKYNKGLYQARRTGIINSYGKYIMHLDGDDFLKCNDKTFLKDAVKKLDKTNADILFFNCTLTDGKKEWKDSWFEPPKDLNNNEEIMKYFYNNGSHTVWGKIYRKSVIDLALKELKNIDKISLWEDLYQNLIISHFVKSSVTVNKDFYCYRFLSDGNSRRLRKSHKEKESVVYQVNLILKEIDRFMEEKLLYKKYGLALLKLLKDICYRSFHLYNGLPYSKNSNDLYSKGKYEWLNTVIPESMKKNIGDYFIYGDMDFNKYIDGSYYESIFVKKLLPYLFSIIIYKKYTKIRLFGIKITLKNEKYVNEPMVITVSNIFRRILSVNCDDKKHLTLNLLFFKIYFKKRVLRINGGNN